MIRFLPLLFLTACSVTGDLDYSGKLVGHSTVDMAPPTCEQWLRKVQLDLMYCETIKTKLETEQMYRFYCN